MKMADVRLSDAERQWLVSLLISTAHRSPSGAPVPLSDADRMLLYRLLGKIAGIDRVVTIECVKAQA